MHILMTNMQLDHRTGTEIVVRDLNGALRRLGHEVCVYTERPGIISDEIADAGGRVVSSLDDVPFVPDVIHGHHHCTATAAAVRFPSVPMIFVCHDARSRTTWLAASHRSTATLRSTSTAGNDYLRRVFHRQRSSW